MKRQRTEWEHGKSRGMSGKSVLQDIQQDELRRQLRNVVGNLRMRQVQAQEAKKKVRDYTTKLLAGRIQVKSSGMGTQSDIDNIDIAIAQKAKEYRDLTESYFDAIENENRIQNEVGNTTLFWHITNDLPEVANLVEIDADFIATVCALDILAPDVRRYILSCLDWASIGDGLKSGVTGVGADRDELLDVSPIDRGPYYTASDTFFTPALSPLMIPTMPGRIATRTPRDVRKLTVDESVADAPTGQIATRVDEFLSPQMMATDNPPNEVVDEAIANAKANGVSPEIIEAVSNEILVKTSGGADIAAGPVPVAATDMKQLWMLGAGALALAYLFSGD